MTPIGHNGGRVVAYDTRWPRWGTALMRTPEVGIRLIIEDHMTCTPMHRLSGTDMSRLGVW